MPASTDNQPTAQRTSWVRYTLVFIGGVAVAAGVARLVGIWFPGCETFVRTAGGFLEFLGVGSVAWGISEVRRSFGLESTAAEVIADWLDASRAFGRRVLSALGRRPPPNTVTGNMNVSLGGLSVRGRGRVRAGPNATLEERVAHLERVIDSAEDRLDCGEDDLQREIEQRVEAMATEREARDSEDQRINKRLENLAVGGLRLQTVGVLWLFAGLFLANWSAEIAKALS